MSISMYQASVPVFVWVCGDCDLRSTPVVTWVEARHLALTHDRVHHGTRPAAAIESRVFPSFAYDPAAGDTWAERFTLACNPQPELDWPVHRLTYQDEALQTVALDQPFTAADFWACDAMALPFEAGAFGFASALHVLDSVRDPRALLVELARVLRGGARAVLATPYDWSPAVTPMGHWIGGHSQRGPHGGDGAPVLRALLTPGAHPASVEDLALVSEIAALPWHVRLHDRSTVEYQAHVVVAQRSVDG